MSLRKRAAWKAAEIAVVLAAAVILFYRCGPGFVCIGSVWLFIGLLIIAVVPPFIKPALRRCKVSFVLVTLMAVSAVVYTFYETSSRTLFGRYVADPIPASVKILHSEYQGGRDEAIYLHFEMNPGDLNSILAKRHYTTSPDIHGPIGRDPTWWALQSLENPTVYYCEETGRSGEAIRSAAWLWVNEAKTEAYFTYWGF